MVPINAGVYMNVVGSGTRSNVGPREWMNSRNFRKASTSGSNNRGRVVMIGTKYSVVIVVVRIDVRGPIRLLA